MTESVYRKTPLPVRLDLNKRNTREQLSTACDDKRGSLEGVGAAVANSAAVSQKDCADVMRKDLKDWLLDHGITGPPPSAEAEQRAMWQWIRDFHKEYNDDWYTRNMPRLRDQFRPVFVQEMKSMKEKVAPARAPSQNAGSAGATDLLDFGGPAPAKAAEPSDAGTGGQDDLLGMDVTAPTAPVTAAAPPVSTVSAPVDLAAGGDPFAAPSAATSPATAANPLDAMLGGALASSGLASTGPASTGGCGGLDDLLGGLGVSAPSSAAGSGLLNLDLSGYAPAQATQPAPAAGYAPAAPAAATSQAAMLQQLQQQLQQPSLQQQLPTLQPAMQPAMQPSQEPALQQLQQESLAYLPTT